MSQNMQLSPKALLETRITASLCRFCKEPLHHRFVDLGMSPLSNAYVPIERQNQAEKFYPLHAYVCEHCFLVQLTEFESPDVIFSDYAYFSSYSESWLAHCQRYTENVIQRFALDLNSRVIELASNDGYLLQYFLKAGLSVLGVEPSLNVARVAQERGIPTLVRFFGVETARELAEHNLRADLLIANNVLAHVPGLLDFVAGIPIVLKPDGVLTAEFPHLLRLIEQNQFDTIYHEHFSYFSFSTIQRIFHQAGLVLFDVEELPTHGGSLRIYACHPGSRWSQTVSRRVGILPEREREAGLTDLATYTRFQKTVQATRKALLNFLMEAAEEGKQVVGYGAPAKGNTLINYCGVRRDLLGFTVDRSPYKQGRLLPGSRIPILSPDAIRKAHPDYVLILPWNLREEVMESLSYIREWGGQFVLPIPRVEVLA